MPRIAGCKALPFESMGMMASPCTDNPDSVDDWQLWTRDEGLLDDIVDQQPDCIGILFSPPFFPGDIIIVSIGRAQDPRPIKDRGLAARCSQVNRNNCHGDLLAHHRVSSREETVQYSVAFLTRNGVSPD